jgi:hypothetical protein
MGIKTKNLMLILNQLKICQETNAKKNVNEKSDRKMNFLKFLLLFEKVFGL